MSGRVFRRKGSQQGVWWLQQRSGDATTTQAALNCRINIYDIVPKGMFIKGVTRSNVLLVEVSGDMDFVVESQPPLRVIVVSPKRGCCMCVKRTSRRVVARRREDHEIFIIVYEESYRVGCCPHTSLGQAVDFIFIMSSCVKADADDNNLLVFGGELLRPIFMTYDVPTTERRHTLTRCDMKC